VIDVSTKLGFGLQTSLTTTAALMVARVWLGAQRTVGSRVSAMVGFEVSFTVTVAEQVFWFPLSSVAVNCTAVDPRLKNAGALSAMATLESQTSAAETPAKNAASCASLAGTPRLPVHSTVTSVGQLIVGRVVSTTRTFALHESVRLPASVAVELTGVVTFTWKSPGALLVIAGVGSQPSSADTPETKLA